MERVRTRLHDFPPQLAAVIQDEMSAIRTLIEQRRSAADDSQTGENRKLRRWDATMVATGFGLAVALGKLLKLF